MREQLKQESFDSDADDNEDVEVDEFKPIGEVEYTEESDVVNADEDDILVTSKLPADRIMKTKNKDDVSDEDLDDEEYEDDENEIRASKVKTASFTKFCISCP